MAISTTINLLQALNRSITGIKRAPDLDKYPTVIDTANLPMMISWPSEAQFHIKGGGEKRQDRVYRLICYIEPLGQNDIPSRASAAATLLQRVVDTYITAANVALADPGGTNIYQVTIESGPNHQHSDSGLVSNLLFAGKPYHGFEVRVNVRELWS